jgi:hypothetical protein
METSGEVGWYVLGPDQESVGPYARVEIQGHPFALPPSILVALYL